MPSDEMLNWGFACCGVWVFQKQGIAFAFLQRSAIVRCLNEFILLCTKGDMWLSIEA